MGQVNKLDKYKPFNDFWFKDCVYHSLAQIVGNLGLINVLLKDEKMYYESIVENDKVKLTLVEYCEKGWIKCLQEYGIETTFIESQGEQLIDEIKKCIDNQCPVILPIDCYYEEMRYDTFMKQHMPHNIVIIGYNDDNQECDVLEHRYTNDIKYINASIPYEQIAQSYEGYWTYFYKEKKANFISLDTSKVLLSKEKLPVEEIMNTIEIFRNSIKQLNDFVQLFKEHYILKSVDYSIREEYANMFTELVIKRRVLYALVEAIRKEFNLELNEVHIEALNNWTLIMAMTYKIQISERVPQDLVDRVIEILHELCIQENEWSNKMYNQLVDILQMRSDKF